MLNDICWRRSIPRTSMRLATFAQTMSSTKPEAATRIRSQCSYCPRNAAMPAPPGVKNRVCSGNFARSSGLISPQCKRSHCFSVTRISASMDAGFAPGWMRPIRSNQCRLCLCRSASASTYGSVLSGRKKSGELPRAPLVSGKETWSPKKPGGVMPTTVNGF